MITVCEQLEALTGIADSLQEAANALAETITRMERDGVQNDAEHSSYDDTCFAKELVLDELNALRALVTDLRHQEDTINTQRLRIRDLSAMRTIHSGCATSPPPARFQPQHTVPMDE